jgi:hypothetical protein
MTTMRAELQIRYGNARAGGQRQMTAEALAGNILTDFTADLDLLAGRVSAALLETLNAIYTSLANLHGSAWPLSGNAFGTDPSRLASRTGAGLESIRNSITIKDSGSGPTRVIEGHITTGTLTVHENGVTITAKAAKYLTIPMRAALDARGLPLRARARDWDNTFVAQGHQGGLYIFQRQGKDIVPLYILKRSVFIPPRLKMRQTVSYFADRFGGVLAQEFNNTFQVDL